MKLLGKRGVEDIFISSWIPDFLNKKSEFKNKKSESFGITLDTYDDVCCLVFSPDMKR